MTPPQQNPLASRAFSLEFPQSLGTYREYRDVQKMVDTLADAGFPVENTLIVGTDLRLIERVTGRKTWGRVILGGLLGGAWMGLFIGLLLGLFTANWINTVATSVVMGMVFFTVWAVIGNAFSGGQRDFTSLTATIPMQYELLVEHKHMNDARQILSDNDLPLGPGAFGSSATAQAPAGHDVQDGGPTPAGQRRPDTSDTEARRPQFGLPSEPNRPS